MMELQKNKLYDDEGDSFYQLSWVDTPAVFLPLTWDNTDRNNGGKNCIAKWVATFGCPNVWT